MNKIIEAAGQSEARIWIAMSDATTISGNGQLFRISFDA